MERIVSVAIKIGDDAFVCPVEEKAPGWRHGDLMTEMARCHVPMSGEQGFKTSEGRFVDRYEAVPIAVKAGQIIKKTHPLNQLFSEDVW